VLILDYGRPRPTGQPLLAGVFGLKSDVRGQTIMEAFRLQELAEVIRRLPGERIVQGHELELAGVQNAGLRSNAAAVLDRAGTQRGAISSFII